MREEIRRTSGPWTAGLLPRRPGRARHCHSAAPLPLALLGILRARFVLGLAAARPLGEGWRAWARRSCRTWWQMFRRGCTGDDDEDGVAGTGCRMLMITRDIIDERHRVKGKERACGRGMAVMSWVSLGYRYTAHCWVMLVTWPSTCCFALSCPQSCLGNVPGRARRGARKQLPRAASASVSPLPFPSPPPSLSSFFDPHQALFAPFSSLRISG